MLGADARTPRGSGGRREAGMDVYTLLILHRKPITSENTLCGPGSSAHCSVVTETGRKSEKEGPLVAKTLNHPPATQETQVDPWAVKIPWSRKWPPTPVFLPGEPHGQRSLVGYSQLAKASDMASRLSK